MSTPPTDTAPDLAARLVQAGDAAIQAHRMECVHSALPRECTNCHARAAAVAVLRELVERPRHGGPHMYCRSEGELRGLIDEIEGVDRA